MIRAKHVKWAEIVFEFYLKRLFKKSFYDFRIINELPVIDNTKSIVLTPNHFSWWDGFFVYWLNKIVLNKKLFVMMLEDQLKRYWFFNKLGCFSIDLNENKKMIASLKYTMDLLMNSNNLVTIYPQGEIQAYDEKQIILKDGIDFISRKSKTDFQILPIAFRIQYTNERLPIVYARYGNLLSSKQVSNFPQIFRDEFFTNLDLLNAEFSTSQNKSIL
jgi:1-acyl-sn-glycerol-3-phosphate acyltransferase